MAQITVSIGGAHYAVGYQEGEETHLRYLVQQIEQRLARVKSDLTPAGAGHALFLTALLLADEVYDLQHGKMNEDTKKIIQEAEDIAARQEHYQSRLSHAADVAERLLNQIDSSTTKKE